MTINAHVGPFDVTARIGDGDVEITAGIDWHGIKFQHHTRLDVSHPSVSFSTPTIDKYSASVTLGIDAATGDLAIAATECHPKDAVFGKKECSTSTSRVPLLPVDGLCLLAAGVTEAGLELLAHKRPAGLDCAQVRAFAAQMTKARVDALTAMHGIATSPGMTLLDTVLHDLTAADLTPSQLQSLAHIAPETLEDIYKKLFSDARVQAVLPGVAQKLGLPKAATARSAEAMKDEPTPTGQKVLEVIAEVLTGLLVAAGLAIAFVGIVATVALAIAAAAAVGGAVLIATIVIGVLALGASLVVVIPALVFTFALMAISGALTIAYG